MPKAKISHFQIIQASLETLAKCPTLDAFSMRKVAATLPVDVSTIYWHFENKQALLQAMADEIAAQITFPDSRLAWQQQLTQLFNTIFSVYVAHPHAAELMLATVPSSKIRLSLMNRTISILVTAGFSEQQSSEVMSTINFFLTGLVIHLSREYQLQNNVTNKQTSYLQKQVTKVPQITHEEKLAHMQNAIQEHHSQSAKQQFEVGLKLIIKGLVSDQSH